MNRRKFLVGAGALPALAVIPISLSEFKTEPQLVNVFTGEWKRMHYTFIAPKDGTYLLKIKDVDFQRVRVKKGRYTVAFDYKERGAHLQITDLRMVEV